MIPLERVSCLHAWRVAEFYSTETSHGEAKQQEASKAGPEFACDETQRWGYRYRSHRNLCGRACGSRQRLGAIVFDLYAGSARVGGLAAALPCGYGRHGIHRRLLDSTVPNSGSAWYRGPFGQRSTCASRSRSQIRCFGLPVASVFAFRRFITSLVSARTIHLRNPFFDATS